ARRPARPAPADAAAHVRTSHRRALERRAVEPSDLSLPGLVRHLTDVGRGRLGTVGGEEVGLRYHADGEWGDVPGVEDADAEADLAASREAVERSRAAVAQAPAGPRRGRSATVRDRRPYTLRRVPRGPHAAWAGSASRRRWLITSVTPSRMVVPYSASAISMVRFWWVTTMSWLCSCSCLSSTSRRPRLTSSSAASTSSRT